KKDNRVVYAEFSELFGSGFIIDGDRIRGKTGTCTIKSRKEEGNSLELSAACASSVMTQDLRFSLKIIDDNNISRSFPEISGMSLGFTIGASTTKLVGRALNLTGPASIEGAYSAIGAGGAIAAGAGGVQLQNANGVILQLSGPKVGAELSAAVGGVTVRLK